ncbi:Pentatricopeptide repeat-containing protein [Acorus gramineus]|uniref:Pentatricopeptide repeat-containing protein n=1 Tax=Acorus gramineus TaxID=55184 RepID=A0AAV9AQ37_ACOGR|nr:Pentatricopeptide repeat-containing protein [Acorus gramineus]
MQPLLSLPSLDLGAVFVCDQWMVRPLPPLSIHYRTLLRRSAILTLPSKVQKLHSILTKTGLLHSLRTALLHAYAACPSSSSSALRLFSDIPLPLTETPDWTALISCCARDGLPQQSLRLFRAMESLPDAPRPDQVTAVSVFVACSQLSDSVTGARAHLAFIKRGLPFTIPARNAAMDMYVKCGRLDDARRVFADMGTPTVVSWTIILNGLVRLDGLDRARKWFDEMPVKNEIAWTVMISAYVERGLAREAMSLLAQWTAIAVDLNHVTLCSFLSSAAQSGDLNMGRWVHAYALKNMRKYEHPMVATALIDMYAKCGRIHAARRVFDAMEEKNVVAWNAMLSGLAMHGHGRAVLSLFAKMDLPPDEITFIGVLSACSHSGLVDEGQRVFADLARVYGVVPTVRHYACMVDLFGRAGRLQEAEAVVKAMPIRPNEVVIGSLLAACAAHGVIELGERMLRELVEMDPLSTGYNVLMSNALLSVGKRDDAKSLRELFKKDSGLRKAPGMSFIEIDGEVHGFGVGDRSHPRTAEVYAMVDEMVRRLRSAGYVPEVASCGGSNVLGDGEEEREQALFAHSERLAVAMGLICTRPGTVLRVFKNLRMCVDCHVAIKLASDVFEREIVVRDRSRFHHFRDGLCSCSDYW